MAARTGAPREQSSDAAVEGEPPADHRAVALRRAREDRVVLEGRSSHGVAAERAEHSELVEEAGAYERLRPFCGRIRAGLRFELRRAQSELRDDAEVLELRH